MSPVAHLYFSLSSRSLFVLPRRKKKKCVPKAQKYYNRCAVSRPLQSFAQANNMKNKNSSFLGGKGMGWGMVWGRDGWRGIFYIFRSIDCKAVWPLKAHTRARARARAHTHTHTHTHTSLMKYFKDFSLLGVQNKLA